jgi:phosphohistidine phosphatase SixA
MFSTIISSSKGNPLLAGCLFLLVLSSSVTAGAWEEDVTMPSFPVEQLKEGGYVIFMRHARREEIPSQAKLWELDRTASCEPGGSLNIQGEAEARSIAKGIKEHAIPAGDVLASPTCRTKQMARILFGNDVPTSPAIAPSWTRLPSQKEEDAAALKELLSRPVPSGTNRFLISHGKLLTMEAIGMEVPLQQTETAVFRPIDGKFDFMGVIRPDDWK